LKKYLLLRNNKRTGPLTYGELLLMDLKPLDLVWVEGESTSWSHPGALSEFSEIPGLAVLNDCVPSRKRPQLSQVCLPAHRLPPSEFDAPPTLALHMAPNQGMKNRSIALQLSLFPSSVTCHAPGGDTAWKSALQLEREAFHHQHFAGVNRTDKVDSICHQLQDGQQWLSDKKIRRGSSRPVICEFRRTPGLAPQFSRYARPTGKDVVIQFLQEDEIIRPGNFGHKG
jgi:hypothetical protein